MAQKKKKKLVAKKKTIAKYEDVSKKDKAIVEKLKKALPPKMGLKFHRANVRGIASAFCHGFALDFAMEYGKEVDITPETVERILATSKRLSDKGHTFAEVFDRLPTPNQVVMAEVVLGLAPLKKKRNAVNYESKQKLISTIKKMGDKSFCEALSIAMRSCADVFYTCIHAIDMEKSKITKEGAVLCCSECGYVHKMHIGGDDWE